MLVCDERMTRADPAGDYFSAHRFFDIRRLRGPGHLILPLSMAKLNTSQSPVEVFKFLSDNIDPKVEIPGIDVLLLFTCGLYQHAGVGSAERNKTANITSRYVARFKKLVASHHYYIPGAFIFLDWNHFIFNARSYPEMLSDLNKAYAKQGRLRRAVELDLLSQGREASSNNVGFILEELVVQHIFREQLVELPRYLSSAEGWSLLAYPGNTLLSDVYMSQAGLLPPQQARRRALCPQLLQLDRTEVARRRPLRRCGGVRRRLARVKRPR